MSIYSYPYRSVFSSPYHLEFLEFWPSVFFDYAQYASWFLKKQNETHFSYFRNKNENRCHDKSPRGFTQKNKNENVFFQAIRKSLR